MKINPLHLIDWYKADHRRQYPEGTQLVFSNFTPRKSRIPNVNHVVFFGLQYFIKEYLIKQWNENFFDKPKDDVIKCFNRRKDTALGPNAIGSEHISSLHDLGYLPIKIMALPEGSRVPIKVPPFVMWNTIPEFFWLVNYLETCMSASLWQMCTSATLAAEYRKLLDSWAKKTGGPMDFVPWQGHDFSFRGMSSIETAAMSGAGHLLSFTGTDTVPAIDFLEEYYNADADKELIGGSVPATEHSVMCMGMKGGEFETFKRLITEVYPEGIVSIVSDTWDLWAVLTDYLPRLKDEIMARNGKVVIRPDSGDPVDIICGQVKYQSKEQYETMKLLSQGASFHTVNGIPKMPEDRGVIELLWDTFGGKINANGYKELDPHIGAIYGDSINLDRANTICSRLEQKGFASTNVVLGIGSYTYQYNTRDTQGWAMKATYGEVVEEWYESDPPQPAITAGRQIFKDPITDSGEKKSAKGLIAVHETPEGFFYMKDQVSWDEVKNCAFEEVFCNGKLLVDHSLADIRKRINI